MCGGLPDSLVLACRDRQRLGKIVFVAGQFASDIDGHRVDIGDMRTQREQTFQNLDRCRKAPGAT
jgi:enamine deaminase RidA (YjgF/YER057c/UK114 family)